MKKISDSAVRRLSQYLRLLRDLEGRGQALVSSRELADGSGTTAAQVRKDLSLFGSFGQRGRGYSVVELTGALEGILGLGRVWRVGLVGAGKIGTALLGYPDLAQRGYEFVAAFDVDPEKIGRRVFGVEISPLDELESLVDRRAVEIAVIATPPAVAQEVADRLGRAGVPAILNFAPVKLAAPPATTVRTMDVSLELEGLSFALSNPHRNGGGDEEEPE